MQNWQKDRNYRKHENEDGSFAYTITVDGETVEVSKDVYEAYSQGDRRERYVVEIETGRLLSLECMDKDNVLLEYLTDKHVESAEDTAVHNLLITQMKSLLPRLDSEEQELIRRLYFDGVSIRKYAKEKGLSDFAMRYRERKTLDKLKKLMEN